MVKTKKAVSKKAAKKRVTKKEVCMHGVGCGNGGCGSGGYCLGIIGAAVYFISTATSFWMGVLGVLKALVWPGILVYEVLKFLGI